jgi:hypothetical protein
MCIEKSLPKTVSLTLTHMLRHPFDVSCLLRVTSDLALLAGTIYHGFARCTS